MTADRKIFVPGEAAPVPAPQAEQPQPEQQRRKPGPKPRNPQPLDDAPAPADAGLGQSAASPAAGGEFSPEQQAIVQRMIADAVRASKAGQDPSTAARLAAQAVDTQRLPTQAAAAAMCEDSLARGVRPRAILTVDGWYTHPEMARTKAPGVAALGGQA